MYIYMLSCEDNSIYTGVAKDIVKRLKEHYFQLSSCAKYTKSHKITGLIALFSTENKSDAMKLEYHIKTLSHNQKLTLANAQNLNDTNDDYFYNLLIKLFGDKIEPTKFAIIAKEEQLEIFSQVVSNNH